MTPLIALIALQGTPSFGVLDRLSGDWTSVETVEVRGEKKTLRLKGKNTWIFRGKLLEMREAYTIEGEQEPGENYILVRTTADGRIIEHWYTPQGDEPIVMEGKPDADGLTLTRKDGRLRVVYKWDGPNAYDAKLQTRRTDDETWADRTVARYKKS